MFATSRETSQSNDAHEISIYINNVIQKNPPNYCQGLSMFPVPDNKNVRNSRPLANVGNFQQNCNRASKGSTRTRTTTKRSACETIVRARAMQARSDNVWRDGKCAMQSLLRRCESLCRHVTCVKISRAVWNRVPVSVRPRCHERQHHVQESRVDLKICLELGCTRFGVQCQ